MPAHLYSILSPLLCVHEGVDERKFYKRKSKNAPEMQIKQLGQHYEPS